MDPTQSCGQPKRLTAIALCVAGLAASTGRAAEPGWGSPPSRFTLFLSPTVMTISFGSCDAPLAIPTDWRARLEPPSANMSVSTVSSLGAGAAFNGLGLEATLRLGRGAEVAALVSYDDLWGASGAGASWLGYRVSAVTARWWNTVTLASLDLRKPYPSVGVSVGGARWRLAVKLHRYELLERQFEGVDCSGCMNYSRLVEEHTRERGWGQRYAVVWQPLRGHLRLEAVHERNGNQIRRWAFVVGARVPLIRSREPEPTAPRPGPP